MNLQISASIAGLDFIEGHLCQPISVGNIAEAAGYSLFHFIRTFNKVVRHTPYDYLMRRRLSHAARLLLDTDDRVLDIALSCQFESHEGFTRAFGRVFGMPPTVWREKETPDLRLLMLALTKDDLLFRQNPGYYGPELITMNKIILVGWMNFIDSMDREKNRQVFKKSLSNNPIPNRVDDALWQVHDLPMNYGQQEMIFVGVQVNEIPTDPIGYVIKIIEKGKFLCLSDIQMPESRDAALKYIYHTFLPKSGLHLGSAFELACLSKSNKLFVPVVAKL